MNIMKYFCCNLKIFLGLYGDNGILPARSLLENSKHKTFSDKVHYQPTLLWLAPYLGLDVGYALDLLALLGTFLAFTGYKFLFFCKYIFINNRIGSDF